MTKVSYVHKVDVLRQVLVTSIQADFNDGSCEYISCVGCMNPFIHDLIRRQLLVLVKTSHLAWDVWTS